MSDEDSRLHAATQRVDAILGELHAMVGPPAWQRIEALLQTVTGLYAAGLEHAIDHATATGADAARLAARLCDDELTASLLLLHGLHPVPTTERVERALTAARTRLGLAIAVDELDRHGVLSLHAEQGLPSCPSSRASLQQSLADLVYEHAPEVVGVRLHDARDASGGLVQIDVRRSGRCTA